MQISDGNGLPGDGMNPSSKALVMSPRGGICLVHGIRFSTQDTVIKLFLTGDLHRFANTAKKTFRE